MASPDKNILVLIGAGSIGSAIAQRVGTGKHILLADRNSKNLEEVALHMQTNGFEVSQTHVDIASSSSIEELVATATRLGKVEGLIHAAGVSPSQADPATILQVDLYGTAVILDLFGNIIEPGGAGLVISSQSGHRLPALTLEQDNALASLPADELLSLPFLQPDQIRDSLHAYQLSKRGNSLRVRGEAVRWGKRKARINAISPGIILTPVAEAELAGPRGDLYRRMIEMSPAGRAGSSEEVANVAALLMGPEGSFITGSDILMDGGATAAYWSGALG